MISRLIDWVDSNNDLIRKKWGLCETLEIGDNIETGKYISSSKWDPVSNISKYAAVSYWKQDGPVSQELNDPDESTERELIVTYPLVQRVFVKRDYLSKDNPCSVDELFHMLNDRNTEPKAADRATLGIQNLKIFFNGYTTDIEGILEEDFGDEGKASSFLKYLVLSLNIEIEVLLTNDCYTDPC